MYCLLCWVVDFLRVNHRWLGQDSFGWDRPPPDSTFLLFLRFWDPHVEISAAIKRDPQKKEKEKRTPLQWYFSIQRAIHLPLEHVSNLISESIHINLLITKIKKNKIIYFFFSVKLNIFTNFLSSILALTSFHLYYLIHKLVGICLLYAWVCIFPCT